MISLCTLEVPMADAILGARTTVAGFDREVNLSDLKPGTQSGDVFTVKARGLSKLRGTGRGDLRVGIQVVTPTKLDNRERELIQQFAAGGEIAFRPN